MENKTNTEQISQTNTPTLEGIAADTSILALIGDISTARFGEPLVYEAGDIDAMTAVMRKTFDLRKPGGERTEREDLPQKDEFADRITDMAQKVGLAGDSIPSDPNADAVVVLGGAGKSPLDRAAYAKEMLDNGTLKTDTVVLLGSSRPVNQAERDRGGSYAEGANDEYALMQLAAQEVFGVTFDDTEELQGYDDKVPTGFEAGWKMSHASTLDGKDVFVLSAPMLTEDRFYPDGNRRPRANTADTYDLLARVAQLGEGSRVVPVTNAHFKPFQGADAVAELSKYGVEAEVVGFDPSHFGNAPKQPEELLQETLSAVNSMVRAKAELAKTVGGVGVISQIATT